MCLAVGHAAFTLWFPTRGTSAHEPACPNATAFGCKLTVSTALRCCGVWCGGVQRRDKELERGFRVGLKEASATPIEPDVLKLLTSLFKRRATPGGHSMYSDSVTAPRVGGAIAARYGGCDARVDMAVHVCAYLYVPCQCCHAKACVLPPDTVSPCALSPCAVLCLLLCVVVVFVVVPLGPMQRVQGSRRPRRRRLTPSKASRRRCRRHRRTSSRTSVVNCCSR